MAFVGHLTIQALHPTQASGFTGTDFLFMIANTLLEHAT